MMTHEPTPYRGNDKLLFGIILGVLAFWLFAQTTLNIAPAMATDLEVPTNVMNIAVSITALFSGIFIVVVGGLADRVGRVKILMWGFILSIVGSLLVGIAPPGALAVPVLMLGRIVQGLSARVHHARQSGAHQDVLGRRRPSARGQSLVHGLLGRLWIRRALRRSHGRERRMALDLLRVGRSISGRDADGARHTGEQGCVREGLPVRHDGRPDVHGDDGGIAGAGHAGERNRLDEPDHPGPGCDRRHRRRDVLQSRDPQPAHPFVNFALFRNSTYTGATISNFLLNGVAGMLLVSMMLVQLGGGLSAQEAGMLTLGYAIAIVAFIRVGEKLLQRFGARKPMIWGSLIVGLSIAMLMPTNLLIGQYTILAVVAYTLFGLGLAFYATPSTDAALSNLPDDQAGSGSGLYKMASSLGASFGVAISAAIFTALSADRESTRWLDGVITFAGRQDNVAVRQAALIALAFNLLMVVAAIVSIMLTVPKGRNTGDMR